MVLNNNEEYLPSETDSIGEEPARPVEKPKDDQDAVSRNSLEDEVRVFGIVNCNNDFACVLLGYRESALETNFMNKVN